MSGQVIERCRGCGSINVAIERGNGWVTRSWRLIRCQACGRVELHQMPGWTLALYAIAAGAAIWGWIVVF